jgi:hypothetical protein
VYEGSDFYLAQAALSLFLRGAETSVSIFVCCVSEEVEGGEEEEEVVEEEEGKVEEKGTEEEKGT